jgi:hypothetical protein
VSKVIVLNGSIHVMEQSEPEGRKFAKSNAGEFAKFGSRTRDVLYRLDADTFPNRGVCTLYSHLTPP